METWTTQKTITPRRAAKIANLSREGIYNLIYRGLITSTKSNTGRHLIDVASFKGWIDKTTPSGLSLKEIMKRTKMGKTAVYRMAADPRVNVECIGRKVYIPKEEVNKYIKMKRARGFANPDAYYSWNLIGEQDSTKRKDIPDGWITLREAAFKTGISKPCLHSYVSRSLLGGIKVGGIVYISPRQLNKLITELQKSSNYKERREWKLYPIVEQPELPLEVAPKPKPEKPAPKPEPKPEPKEVKGQVNDDVSKTLIEMVMDELGIEPDVAYAVEGGGAIKMDSRGCYVADNNGNYHADAEMLGKLIAGKAKVLGALFVKPALPKKGDSVFFYNITNSKVEGISFNPNRTSHLLLWKCGLMFNNRNTAVTAGKSGIEALVEDWKNAHRAGHPDRTAS